MNKCSQRERSSSASVALIDQFGMKLDRVNMVSYMMIMAVDSVHVLMVLRLEGPGEQQLTR